MDVRSEEKKKRLEEALEHGITMVHLDARRPGVLVPEKYREDHHLRLNFSLRFDPPDLTVGDWGIRQTLSFQGARFKVAVPWGAVFAITANTESGEAWMYPEDMPEELIEAAARQHGLTGEEPERRGPALAVVPDEGEPESEEVGLAAVPDPADGEAEAEAEPESSEPEPESQGPGLAVVAGEAAEQRFVPRLVKVEPETPPAEAVENKALKRAPHLRIVK